jgi:predicted oxidoreductase (fatty acid repression mutant protein)
MPNYKKVCSYPYPFRHSLRLAALTVRADRQEFFDWSENSAGILQYIVWTALSIEGIGASLQHFGGMNQEVNKGLLKLLELPEEWQSSAIMPFGVPAAPAGDKQFSPIEERVKVFTGSK